MEGMGACTHQVPNLQPCSNMAINNTTQNRRGNDIHIFNNAIYISSILSSTTNKADQQWYQQNSPTILLSPSLSPHSTHMLFTHATCSLTASGSHFIQILVPRSSPCAPDIHSGPLSPQTWSVPQTLTQPVSTLQTCMTLSIPHRQDPHCSKCTGIREEIDLSGPHSFTHLHLSAPRTRRAQNRKPRSEHPDPPNLAPFSPQRWLVPANCPTNQSSSHAHITWGFFHPVH